MSKTQKPLNVEQATEWLNLKPSYIYNLVFSKKLVAYKPGEKRLFSKFPIWKHTHTGTK
jgi:excisionase family DNA binding protein